MKKQLKITIALLVIVLVSIVGIVCLQFYSRPSKDPINSESSSQSTASEESSELDNDSSKSENVYSGVPSDENKPNPENNRSNPSSTSEPYPNNTSNTEVPKQPEPSTTKKDYRDISGLTGTQQDVGKVVGYSTLFAKDIIVTSVREEINSDGLKVVVTTFSDGIATCVVQCKYCRQFPCPNGGGEKCPKYDIKLDYAKTCKYCGRPIGNGYNGTCHGLIDWQNGGKHSCNHYD